MSETNIEKSIIRLMQSEIMEIPVRKMTTDAVDEVHDCVRNLIEWELDKENTGMDYLQMARLSFCDASLCDCETDLEGAIKAYKKGCELLMKAGIDVSINRWAKLVNLPNEE